ncbi:MAG TPA: WhiB family transcriptional regulator [Candidatus Saccharimonadales bacterium]
MATIESSKGSTEPVPNMSTAEILFAGLLPATYLNQFSAAVPPKGEIGLRGNGSLRVNEQIIPVYDRLQVFALNCVAVAVGKPVSGEHINIIGEGGQQRSGRRRFAQSFLPLVDQINEAIGEELIKVDKGRVRTYSMRVTQFVQDRPPQNELFGRLTPLGRQKFGARILGVVSGNVTRLAPTITQPTDPLLTIDPEGPEAWRLESACRGKDTNLFFPDRGEPHESTKELCNKYCPVTADCLHYAIENKITRGMWGGLSEKARKKLNKKSMGLD